jgi:hypothetical protein
VPTQDDLDATTLDVGKLSEVPEITKVLVCFGNSIIDIDWSQQIFIGGKLYVGKLNFLTKDVYSRLHCVKISVIQPARHA